MPTNLPAEYYEVEERYKAAESPAERVRLLEELISTVPKHKGTDKVRAEVSSRLANLRKEAQKKPAKRKKYGYDISRQGAAQIALIGAPNVGKSRLVVNLTNAETEVATYPFTTAKPAVGMMPFQDISMQLVDTPPVTNDYIDQFLPEFLRRVDH